MTRLIYPIQQPVSSFTYPPRPALQAEAAIMAQKRAAIDARPTDLTVANSANWEDRRRAIPRQLKCLENPALMEQCQRDRASVTHHGRCWPAGRDGHDPDCPRCVAGPQGRFYMCPQGCPTVSYLYPRKIRGRASAEPKRRGVTAQGTKTTCTRVSPALSRRAQTGGPPGRYSAWHYHQGADLSGRLAWDRIVSVSAGKVIRRVDRRAASRRDRSNIEVEPGTGGRGGYGGYGKCLVIDPGIPGVFYFYAHCDQLLVAIGDDVSVGTPLAMVGRTLYDRVEGRKTGPHLHFEVRTQVNPNPTVGFYGECTPDHPPEGDGNRIDPRAHLDGGASPHSSHALLPRDQRRRPPARSAHKRRRGSVATVRASRIHGPTSADRAAL